jgi:hypothetical protein
MFPEKGSLFKSLTSVTFEEEEGGGGKEEGEEVGDPTTKCVNFKHI